MFNRTNLFLFRKVCYRKWRTSSIISNNLSFNNFEVPNSARQRNRRQNGKYESNENEYFHKILVSNKKYTNTIAFLDGINVAKCNTDVNTILNNDLTNISNHLLVDYMKIILNNFEHCPETFDSDEPAFTKFCSHLQSKIPNFLDENLLHLLKILTLWPEVKRSDLFYELCKSLDEELLKRNMLWGRDKTLLIMDHLYRLGILKYSNFFWRTANRFFNEPEKLNSMQLVHIMFLMNSCRKWDPGMKMFPLELALSEIIYELTAEEVAIVALAFFKTQNKIKSTELLNFMFKKLAIRMNSVDSITLTAFLKVLRYSSTFSFRHRITDILDMAIDRIDDVSLTCCIHLALLGTQILVFHPESLKKICARFVKEISSARLKDLERIVFTLELFNFNPETEPNIFDLIIQELSRREEEILKYPKVFVQTLHYLAIMKIYNYDLLHKALSDEFIKNTFKISRNFIPRDLIQLSCGVKLECPDYAGDNFDAKFIEEMSKNLCWKMSNQWEKYLSKGNTIMLHAKNELERIFDGPEFVHYVYVLPYSIRPEVIVCLKDKKPIKIPYSIKSREKVLDFTSPPSIGCWYVFLFWGMSTTIVDIEKPVGSLLAKMRHLKILGYKPLLIKEGDWDDPNLDKVTYLTRLMGESG